MQQHPSLNPLAPEIPTSDVRQNTMPMGFYNALRQQNRLMELLVERQQQRLLPSQTLTNFTGYPLEFLTFMQCYE